MKTVYFVRHGESEANVGTPVFQGEESRLTERGHEQARFIAKRCSKLPIEVVIASPAARAQDTAQYISEVTDKNIVTENLFTERKLPEELIGKPVHSPQSETLYDLWEASFFDETAKVGTGENFAELKERAGKALAFLTTRAEENILVVTHGFFLRMLVAQVIFGEAITTEEFKKVIQAIRTANTGLTLVEYEPIHGGAAGLPAPRWLIRVWNDHAHLG